MSSNYNHNDFPPGEYSYGENGYWGDNNFNAFDPELLAHDDIEQAHDGDGQDWTYAPDAFDLAGRSEQHTQPFAWSNNIESNTYFQSADPNNQFNNAFDSIESTVDTQYRQNAFSTAQDDFTSQSRPAPRHSATSGSGFPASPYAFDNNATIQRPVQSGAIAPQALQLSEPAKGSVSREVRHLEFSHRNKLLTDYILVHTISSSKRH